MNHIAIALTLTGLLLMSSRASAIQSALPAAGATQQPGPVEPAGIIDNSFLIEEAFNEERGVFQNIFNYQRQQGEWIATFTQEWPAPGMRHQLSYTIPFGRIADVAGLGDVLVNYRLQALTETASRPAFSPRVSVILPTARTGSGLGDDVTGYQVALPFSKRRGDVYFHWNAGLTYIPAHAAESLRLRRAINNMLGGSAIWLASPTFNVMLEAVLEFEDDPRLNLPARTHDVTVSPGFRHAWNHGERQLVWGLAVPVSLSAGDATAAAFVYLSYELSFKR